MVLITRQHYTSISMTKIKIVAIPDSDEDVEKLNSPKLVCWECKLAQPHWQCHEVNMCLMRDLAVACQAVYPRGFKTYCHTGTCAQWFMAALFIVGNNQIFLQ